MGLDVIGWYHSHPDHEARPSEYDRAHAWPWLSYVIVRVAGGTDHDLRSFVLRDDRTAFDPEPVVR
jgi:proteasome lid subunit RPN8/RPN11